MDKRQFLALLVVRGLQYDPEDEVRLLDHFWVVTYSGKDRFPVLYTTVDTKLVYMHRYLLGVTDSKVFVDHKDGDRFNNKRSNLRLCNNQQNCTNQKPRFGLKYKGVSKLPSGMYRARVAVEGKHVHIGVYATEDLAALAYNDAALWYHGEFARLNTVEA